MVCRLAIQLGPTNRSPLAPFFLVEASEPVEDHWTPK